MNRTDVNAQAGGSKFLPFGLVAGSFVVERRVAAASGLNMVPHSSVGDAGGLEKMSVNRF